MTEEINGERVQLKSYSVTLPDAFRDYPYDYSETIVAKSASAARYKFWQWNLSETYWNYSDVFRRLKSRTLGPATPSSFFPETDAKMAVWESVVKWRGLKYAFLGQRIDVDGKMGTIVGGNDSLNLNVVMDGESRTSNVHPSWETTYFSRDGSVVKNFKENSCPDPLPQETYSF
jgi:hypothetical protein